MPTMPRWRGGPRGRRTPTRPGKPSPWQVRIDAVRARLAPRWQALAPRERLGMQWAGVALAVLLAWWLAVAPALRTLRTAPTAQAALDADLEGMRRLASEVQDLRRQPPLPAAQAEAALKAATDRLGAAARLVQTGDRITVTLTGVEPAAFMAWLNDVRGAARARPVEATLTRVGAGYSGTVTLALSSTP